MDRTVGNLTPSVYKSIAEIVPKYPGTTAFAPYPAVVLHHMYTKSVGHDTPRLLIPAFGVIATEDDQYYHRNVCSVENRIWMRSIA